MDNPKPIEGNEIDSFPTNTRVWDPGQVKIHCFCMDPDPDIGSRKNHGSGVYQTRSETLPPPLLLHSW